jgi:hypothetical protein
MSSDEEWKQFKLDCLEYLRGYSFQLADYIAPNAEWDHDHCEGCMAKFAGFDAPDILQSVYCTMVEDDYEPAEEPMLIQRAREMGRNVMKKPDTRKWVCQKCLDEFRGALGWKLEPTTQT